MSFLKWPLKNPVFINMIMVLLIVVGLMSLRMMPSELNPEVSLNWANVSVLYNGASPEEMENLVTIKLEDALDDIERISSVQSWSGEGFSRLSIKFEDIPEDEFNRYYQEAVSEINKVVLPDGAEEPFFFKWSSATFLPVLNIAVYGNVDEKELKFIAEELKDQVSDLKGISKINIAGDRDREVWIEVIPEKLTSLKMTFDEVQNAVMSKNLNISAGAIKGQKNEVVLRAIGEFKTIQDIEQTIVRYSDRGVIYLKDIANIKETFKRAASKSKFDGKKAITISAYKKPGIGTMDVVEDIRTIIDEFKSKIPSSIGIGYATDTSYLINDGLGVLSSNALFGVILVLFILHIFLGPRNAIFAAIGIPTSFLITFIFLELTDQTLNLNVMFGMVLVLGMIVDDAMVIIENVYRYIEQGMSPIQAVIKGVPEVAIPVTSSILTTMAAFLPLMLMPGIMGKFMRTIPFVVCLSLMASIVEAFFIMPVHIAAFGRINKKAPIGDKFINKLREIYDRFLKISINYRTHLVAAVSILIFTGIGMLVDGEGKMGVIFMMGLIVIITLTIRLIKRKFHFHSFYPLLIIFAVGSFLVFSKTISVNMFANDPLNMMFIRVKAPQGTSLDEMERILAKFEKSIAVLPDYEYKNVITNVGILNMDTEQLDGSNYGEIIFDVVPKKERSALGHPIRHQDEMIKDLKEASKDITGVDWVGILYPQDGPPSGKAVEVKILGKDFDILKEIGSKFENYLDTVTGIKNINSDYEEGKTELRFYENELKIRQAGLSNALVSNSLQKMINGQPVGIMRDADEELMLMLKFPEDYIDSKSKASSIRIPNLTGDMIPLSNLGEFKEEKSLSTIKRYKGSRSTTISADIESVDPNNPVSAVAVNNGLIKYFDSIKSEYPGYRISFEGEFKEFEDSFSSLVTLFFIGIGFMFVILGTQFRSWLYPFMILMTIPLAFVGAIFGLAVSGNPFSIGSMYGMVALAGVVVNSSIVLVDFINKNIKSGMTLEEAVIDAGHVRFRPIILTTITTVFGMLPLAIGLGGANVNWQPLAIVIVAGLSISTLLTLYIIPAFYIMFNDFQKFYKRSKWFRVSYRTLFSLLGLMMGLGSIAEGSPIVGVLTLLIFGLVAFMIDLELHDIETASKVDDVFLELSTNGNSKDKILIETKKRIEAKASTEDDFSDEIPTEELKN